MLFLLSYLLLFAAAITALLLVVDSVYARVGADRRLDHAGGRHWAPDEVLLEEPATGRSLLPAEVRSRAWWVLLGLFLLGAGLLFLAS